MRKLLVSLLLVLPQLGAAKVPDEMSAQYPEGSFVLSCSSDDKQFNIDFLEVEDETQPLLMHQSSQLKGAAVFEKLGPPDVSKTVYWHSLWESWGISHLWNDTSDILLDLSESNQLGTKILTMKLEVKPDGSFAGPFNLSLTGNSQEVLASGNLTCIYSAN